MPIPIELTVYRGAERVARHHFERDIVKIGRLGSAHLKLDDKRVSRIHAVIEAGGADGGSYAIIDMGSAEGTFVNGRKVSKQWLVNGDTIAVGDFEVRVTFGGGTQDMATQDVVAVENLPLADELRTTASLGKALERTSLDALTPGNGMTTVTRSMAPSKDLSEVINTSISASAGDPGVSSGPRFSAPAQSAVAQVRAAEPFGTGGLAAAVDGLRRSSVSMVPPNGQVTPAEWPRAAPESFPHELVGEPTLQGGPLPSEWSNLPVEQVRQKIDKWTAPTGNMGVSEVLPRPPDDSVPPPPSDPTNGSQSAKGPPASPASSQRAKGSRSAKGPPASPASSQRAKGSRSVKKGPPGSPHRTK
ncbi:MAG: FHA domain-containing protein, partial [Myxococcales bacterium]|nr:FHA domain-containing protein [Myxococcales bacterium]